MAVLLRKLEAPPPGRLKVFFLIFQHGANKSDRKGHKHFPHTFSINLKLKLVFHVEQSKASFGLIRKTPTPDPRRIGKSRQMKSGDRPPVSACHTLSVKKDGDREIEKKTGQEMAGFVCVR